MPRFNVHTSRFLWGILEECGWTETCLAKRAGISKSVVSTHLAGQRQIRRNHIQAYLKTLDKPADRVTLLCAWLSDDGFDPSLSLEFRRFLGA
jgi:DNA transposition AAA+ family ATPase